jgi:O-antigen ligase
LAAPRRFPQIYLPLLGVGLVALWPLTAYAFNPVLLPALLIAGTATLVVLKWPEWGLAIAIALIPLIGVKLPQGPSVGVALPGEPFRLLVPLMILTVLAYGIVIYGIDRRRLPGITVGVALLILSAVISAFNAIDPARSTSDVFLLLTGAALFVAVLNICRTREQLFIVLAGVLAALLIASVHGIVQHFVGDFSTQGFVAGGVNEGRVQGAFGHPNEYAGFLALLMPLAFAVTFTKSLPGALRRLAGLAAAASVPALVYSYARGALVTLVLGTVLWLVLLRPRYALVLAAVVGLALIAAAPSTLKERLQPSRAQSDLPLRTDVADSALQIYGQHPLLGVGLGNFQLAYAGLSINEAGSQKRLLHDNQLLVPTAPPSQYLNTLAEQGLVGIASLAIFLLLALATAYRACKSAHPAVRGIGLGLGAGIFALVIYSLLEISLQEAQLMPLFVLAALASVAQTVYSPQPAKRYARASRRPRRVAAVPARPALPG